MAKAITAAAASLLTPDDHVLVMIDHQSQMAFPVRSIDVALLRTNTGLLSRTAVGFSVPTVLTTVARSSFSGPLFPEIADAFGDAPVIDRTTMNCWEDAAVTARVNEIGRQKLVFAGLWTSVCIVGPVLSALEQDFPVYVITDACGDVSDEAHERAVQRMLQAGAQPLTSLQYMLELQRDWARGATYDLVTGIARSNAGGYGIGIQYARSMFGAQEGN